MTTAAAVGGEGRSADERTRDVIGRLNGALDDFDASMTALRAFLLPPDADTYQEKVLPG